MRGHGVRFLCVDVHVDGFVVDKALVIRRPGHALENLFEFLSESVYINWLLC